MKRQLTPELAVEYRSLFASADLRPERRLVATRIRDTILKNRERYDRVGQVAKVPWFVVGIIHSLECSSRFDCHLHNGDPLVRRTVHVPTDRPAAEPKNPPGYSWEESAVDALDSKDMNRERWSVAEIAFTFELYNGFGYRNRFPFVKSPYLWSFSTAYTAGKFVGDHKFSTTAVSKQCGGMVLLKLLMDKDDEIRAAVETGAVKDPDPDSHEDPEPTPHDPDDGSRDDWPTPPVMYSGRYLSRGSTGDEVIVLQKRLTAVGAAPRLTNGVFDQSTEIAVQLVQARSVDEEGEPLEIDGVVGPVTWQALFGPDSVPSGGPVMPPPVAAASLVSAILDVATSQIGVMERPPGSNKGPEVEMYLRSVGVSPGNAWCMAFVYWVHQQAVGAVQGSRLLVPKTGVVKDAWARSLHLPEITVVRADQAKADPSRVKPGMVFFLGFAEGGHCGIVVENNGGRLTTIEGNTNDNGSRNGIGVFLREKRRTSGPSLLGFAGYF